MPASEFDPRRAALHHAAESRMWADRLSSDANGGVAMAIGELANAVACGLVYVGDAIGREHAAGAMQDGLAEAIARTNISTWPVEVRDAFLMGVGASYEMADGTRERLDPRRLVLIYPEGTAPPENAPDGTYGGSREVDDGDTGN